MPQAVITKWKGWKCRGCGEIFQPRVELDKGVNTVKCLRCGQTEVVNDPKYLSQITVKTNC